MPNEVYSVSEFQAWKDSEITKELYKAIIEEINTLAAALINTGGLNQLQDRYNSGKVSGLSFVADWEPTLKGDMDEV